MIKASTRISDYENDRRHWLKFEGVDNFVVEGNGIINGNGRKWWQNSCKVNKELVNIYLNFEQLLFHISFP